MDKFPTNNLQSICENCGKYTHERLLVKLPEILKRSRNIKKFKNQEKAYLCFDCVKNYCRTTLSDFWKMFIFPKSKEAKSYRDRFNKGPK